MTHTIYQPSLYRNAERPPRERVSSNAGLFRTEDGGTTFVSVLPRVYPPAGVSVVAGALGTGHLYLASTAGIAFSPDNGNSWKMLQLRSPAGSGDVNGSPMFEMVFEAAHSIALDIRNPARLLACGITALVTWDGSELISGPGIYDSAAGETRISGMSEVEPLHRRGAPPDCLFTAVDSFHDGAWIGTTQRLLYTTGQPQPAWRDVTEFRDIAVFAATITD